MYFVLSELDEVLGKLTQGPYVSRLLAAETTKTSREETEIIRPKQRVRSKRTLKTKKNYATDELARFLVTGPADASNKLSEFYWWISRKDVTLVIHWSSEILCHLRRFQHFSRDQRLQLETSRWRDLNFDGNPLSEGELEGQYDKIQRAPTVVRDRDSPFNEGLIPNASGYIDPQLPMLNKVSSLVDVLHHSGSFGLVERLWEQLVLTASRVKITVAWSQD